MTNASKRDAAALSDWDCLLLLQSPLSDPSVRSDAVIVYKALAALANSGIRRPEESDLPAPMRALLEARRLLAVSDADGAYALLSSSTDPRPENKGHAVICEGDRLTLQAFIRQRRADLRAACGLHEEATRIHSQTRDKHRAIRSLINGEICRNDLRSFLSGELFSLERMAREEKYPDLVGNIQKARAVELIIHGRFAEALPEALASIERYQQDGHPVDLAISRCLVAILHHMNGQPEEARRAASEVHLRDGKVLHYWQAYEALASGKMPTLPAGHPLDGTPWPIHRVRNQSVKGRILQRLNLGPATRDELLQEIWGQSSSNAAYCSRLYATINQLRKQGGVQILFDGGRYRLG